MACGSSCSLGSSRWRQPLFSVGSRDYDWLDVFLSAMVRGEWASFERRLVEGVARCERAKASVAWPRDQRLSEAATQFRYDRNLLTTEETQAWLSDHGITTDQWLEYLMRELLWRDRGVDPNKLTTISEWPAEVARAFAPEGLCSGTFQRFATTCAGHVAVVATSGVSSPAALADAHAQHLRTEHQEWLAALDAVDITTRLVHLATVDSQFGAAAAAAATEDALAAQIARHRVEWTRIRLDLVSFRSVEAALEATCCVREDGLTLRDVAVASRQPLRSTCELLERLDPNLRDAGVCANVGDLIGPVPVATGFEVGFVAGKEAAQLDDPTIRVRARGAIVEQLVSTALLSEVHWINPRL
jgi:hypothetical protein